MQPRAGLGAFPAEKGPFPGLPLVVEAKVLGLWLVSAGPSMLCRQG